MNAVPVRPPAHETGQTAKGKNESTVPKLGLARRKYIRQSRRARGIPATIPGKQATDHVNWLHSLGFSDTAISAAAGLPQFTVYRIRIGYWKTTRIEQASKLLAVTHVPQPAQAHKFVPALGVSRRLTALGAIGHPQSALADRLGIPQTRLSYLIRCRVVEYETWREVADLYEELSGTPGTSKRAINWSRKHGYAPPLAWEGLDIDDPRQQPIASPDSDTETVDEVLFERILRGQHKGDVREPERTAVLDHAIANNWGYTKVSELLNVTRGTADAALVRRRRKLREQEAA
jgi:hypothetical protein